MVDNIGLPGRGFETMKKLRGQVLYKVFAAILALAGIKANAQAPEAPPLQPAVTESAAVSAPLFSRNGSAGEGTQVGGEVF